MSRLRIACCLAMALLPPASTVWALQTGVTGGGQPIDNMQPSLGINYLIRVTGEASGLGEVVPFAGSFTPQGWLKCEGQTLTIAGNPDLYAKIGGFYGGDGLTTFNLPNLQSRTAIHQGTGDGLSPRALGDRVGVEQVTLTNSQMPAHDHSLPLGGDTSDAGGNQPFNNMQPSLALNYVLPLQGNWPFPDSGPAQAPFFGQVRLFGGTNIPAAHVPADGQLQQLALNTSLFAILGTTYGGNGSTTFALPDLRGRTAIHEGTGPGLTPRARGEEPGSEHVLLTENQLPSHDHTLSPAPEVTGFAGGGLPFDSVQPSGVLNYIIATSGEFPSAAIDHGGATFIGKLALYGGAMAPDGWAFCDGQLVTISQNTALFAILGTTFGGDGAVTFAIPDLRGRTIVGAGDGPGLSERLRGEGLGLESTALSVAQLPPHTHEYVPEPSSFTMLLLATLAGGRRQRIRQA